MNTSITYGQIFNTNSDFDEATGIGDKAYNVVFSADVPLAPGLVLAGDVSKFDNDATERLRHRRQGLDRGGQRPPGVLIARISRRSGGACPAAFRFDRRGDPGHGSVQGLQIEGEELESREFEPRAQGARQPDPSW